MPISGEHLRYVVSLYECFNNNTLGKLWTSSMPYLFPFIVEYRYFSNNYQIAVSTCIIIVVYL